MAELVANLGYKTRHGKNYDTVQKRLEKFNISTDHFVSRCSNRVITKEDVFCENSSVSQNTLRRFYLKEKDIEYKCNKCGVGSIWNGNNLTLQLDHIDGNNGNNLLSNLRWLCPNCHSQTKTFAGKNVQHEKHKNYERKHYYCIDCGKEVAPNSVRCKQCSSLLQRKVLRPSKNELENLLKTHNGNFTSVGSIFNVSDNTIRKWCKYYGLSTQIKDYKIQKPKMERKPVATYGVDQIDMVTGEVIASYKSCNDAIKQTGIHHINQASDPNNTKRNSAGGYIWKRKA